MLTRAMVLTSSTKEFLNRCIVKKDLELEKPTKARALKATLAWAKWGRNGALGLCAYRTARKRHAAITLRAVGGFKPAVVRVPAVGRHLGCAEEVLVLGAHPKVGRRWLPAEPRCKPVVHRRPDRARSRDGGRQAYRVRQCLEA